MPGDKTKAAIRDRFGNIIRGNDEQAEAAANAVWHQTQALSNVGRLGDDNTVVAILERYLDDLQKRASAKSYANYRAFFQSFDKQWPGLLVRDLKPFHVQQWWELAHKPWGSSLQNLSGTALKAALRWAKEPGKGGAIIASNPLEGFKLPTMRKRSAEVVVSQEEFDGMLSLVKSDAVRDIIVVAWETGTRPINLIRATAKNVGESGRFLLFAEWNTEPGSTVHKTHKNTGRPLQVPLPPLAEAIIARLAERYPTGPLFRTARGAEWNDSRLANTVLHYAKRAGLAGRFTAYSCRHSKATSLLEAGVSDVDVAAILGNTPAIIHKNYSHVSSRTDRLIGLMTRVSDSNGGTSEPGSNAPVSGSVAGKTSGKRPSA